jgi:hypothetical protein
MDKDRPRTLGLNLGAHFRNPVQSLRAKGARKVAQKDKQNRRFIHQIEQRPARLGKKLAQGVCEIRPLGCLEHPLGHSIHSTLEGNVDYRCNSSDAVIPSDKYPSPENRIPRQIQGEAVPGTPASFAHTTFAPQAESNSQEHS